MTTKLANPAGWPADLMPYNPGTHRPKFMLGCVLYPYDCVPSNVRSWAVIHQDKYLGLIEKGKTANGATQYVASLADGTGRLFHQHLEQAVNFLLYPIR